VRTAYPSDLDATFFRVISDLDLRAKLIAARAAEIVQSPKGTLRCPYIVRLYPNFDAPGLAANGAARAPDAGRPLPARPTVEELAVLVARIAEIEREVEDRLTGAVDERIAELQKTIASSSGAELRATIRELATLFDRRDAIGSEIREAAFRTIESDTTFAPRRYLALISRHR